MSMHFVLSVGHAWGKELSPPPWKYNKRIDIGILFQYKLAKSLLKTYTNLVNNILGLILET